MTWCFTKWFFVTGDNSKCGKRVNIFSLCVHEWTNHRDYYYYYAAENLHYNNTNTQNRSSQNVWDGNNRNCIIAQSISPICDRTFQVISKRMSFIHNGIPFITQQKFVLFLIRLFSSQNVGLVEENRLRGHLGNFT